MTRTQRPGKSRSVFWVFGGRKVGGGDKLAVTLVPTRRGPDFLPAGLAQS